MSLAFMYGVGSVMTGAGSENTTLIKTSHSNYGNR